MRPSQQLVGLSPVLVAIRAPRRRQAASRAVACSLKVFLGVADSLSPVSIVGRILQGRPCYPCHRPAAARIAVEANERHLRRFSASRLRLSSCRRAITRSPTERAGASQPYPFMTIFSSSRVVSSFAGTST